MYYECKTQAQMAKAVVRLQQAGACYHIPLVRAAGAGALRFAIVAPGGRLRLDLLDMQRDRRPLAVILGDDGLAPTGPDGFPQARRLMRWAASIVIHAAAGQPEQYAAVAVATTICRRLVLVECSTAHQADWMALRQNVAPGKPGLLIKVPDGQPPHPQWQVPAGSVMQ